MHLLVLLTDIDTDTIENTLLSFASVIKPLPEDVPYCLDAFCLTVLNQAVLDMEGCLKMATEDTLTAPCGTSTVDIRQLAIDIWQSAQRKRLPNSYEIKVLLSPQPMIALQYNTETFHGYYTRTRR